MEEIKPCNGEKKEFAIRQDTILTAQVEIFFFLSKFQTKSQSELSLQR